MKIYIVEDNSFYAELMSYDLLKNNHDVKLFSNAEDCVEKLKEEIPDLIILDFYLRDGADGFHVLEELRKIETNSDCKVIMLTSSESVSIKNMAKAKGANYFMSKTPDASIELNRLIKKL